MSASNVLVFRAKVTGYKQAHDEDGDTSRYVTNATVAALNLWLAEQRAGFVLPAALSVSSPLFMAAIDSVAHAVNCPVEERMSALEFLQHLGDQVQNRYDSEYAEPVRKALRSVRDGLRNLGLTS